MVEEESLVGQLIEKGPAIWVRVGLGFGSRSGWAAHRERTCDLGEGWARVRIKVRLGSSSRKDQLLPVYTTSRGSEALRIIAW